MKRRNIILLCSLIITTFIGCRKPVIQRPVKNPVAKIIYTDIIPDTSLTGFSPSNIFMLDLNADGVTDFEIARVAHNFICDPMNVFSMTTINLSAQVANPDNAIISDGADYALPLDSSVAILPGSQWSSVSQVLFTWARGNSRCVSAYRSRGLWGNASDKFLGLKFIRNNEVHYGWVRITVNLYSTPNPQQRDFLITIQDYAYNSVANQPIFAGQIR